MGKVGYAVSTTPIRPMEQTLSMVNVPKFYSGQPHQEAALLWLDQNLTVAQKQEFTKRWRLPAKPVIPNPLNVPYFSQNDNASGRGYRECFSSSCAMIAAFYGKVKSDDEYNLIRARFGDTTDSMAQVKTLRHLGLDAVFTQQMLLADLRQHVSSGRPVAVGWLHHGNYRNPSGGGHWSVVVGTGQNAVIHHDPYGLCDLVRGGHVSLHGGKFVTFADQYWLPRWQVKGGDGWAVFIRP